jgi:NTE family protein
MKHSLLLIILIAISFKVCFAQDVKRPKVAVVLSGGGAKGFAHIGALKVLEEEGIPIDIIVGTSMGSIVGGLYSIGYSADEIAELSLSQDWAALLSDNIPRKELDQYSRIERQRYFLTIPLTNDIKPEMPSGLIKGQNVLNFLCGLTANVPKKADFSKFPISFACIGTDLENGEEVIFNSGFLPTAIFSSMAIPGVFAPGEHNGRMYIDGGIVNNFPTDVARKMGADIIIGVDIRNDLHKGGEIKSIVDVLDQLINFYSLEKDSLNKTLCDIRIRPNIDGYNTSSFYTAAVDTLIKRGIKSATEAIDEIRNLKTKYNLNSKDLSTSYVKQKEWKINDISISGNYSMSETFLRDELVLNVPENYAYYEIKKSINNLYGTGNFKRAYFNLEENNDGYCLNINVDEEKTWDVNVGMRLNTKSAISVVLNTTRKDYSKTFGLLSFTADISSNPKINFLLELGAKNNSVISLMVDGMYKNVNVYIDKDN